MKIVGMNNERFSWNEWMFVDKSTMAVELNEHFSRRVNKPMKDDQFNLNCIIDCVIV